MEIFNIVKEILILIIAISGVVIAGMALYTWKKEFIGKKKIDLACDIMEQVCNIQNLIKHIRNHIAYFSEYDKIKEELTRDKKDIAEKRLYCLVAKHSMIVNREEIEKFFKLRNKAQLYWNKDILNLFSDLRIVFQKINDASENLYFTKNAKRTRKFR